MTAYELIKTIAKLAENPEAQVAIVEGDDCEHKRQRISVYRSSDGKVVLQFWD